MIDFASFEEVKELLEKLKIVNSRMGELDLIKLYTFAKNVPENGVIVDIGTFHGSSAFAMALGSDPSVHVYTVDPFDDPAFYRIRKEFGLEDRVIFYKKTGEEVSKDWDIPIDMLFIDAIHNYDGVKQDLGFFGVHVKKGGLILAHDYYLYNGIREAIDESVANGFMEKLEIYDSIDKKDKEPKIMGLFVGRKL